MAHVESIRKRGDYYTVTGYVDGRKVSCEIPAPTVEERSSKDARALAERSLKTTARVEKDASG